MAHPVRSFTDPNVQFSGTYIDLQRCPGSANKRTPSIMVSPDMTVELCGVVRLNRWCFFGAEQERERLR